MGGISRMRPPGSFPESVDFAQSVKPVDVGMPPVDGPTCLFAVVHRFEVFHEEFAYHDACRRRALLRL